MTDPPRVGNRWRVAREEQLGLRPSHDECWLAAGGVLLYLRISLLATPLMPPAPERGAVVSEGQWAFQPEIEPEALAIVGA